MNSQLHHDDTMPLIDEYLGYLRCFRTDATVRTREGILRRLDTDLPLGIEATNADELTAWLYGNDPWTAHAAWSLNTRCTCWTAIKGFFEWACNPLDQWLEHNPVPYMPPGPRSVRGVARPVQDEQLRRILTQAVEPFRLWSLLACYQGLRCIEISRLDREHVTAENLIVVCGKGGKPRVHDTHPDVWAAVKDLPPGPLARKSRTGERETAYYVSIRAAIYFRRRMGMPGVSLHRLRHWLGVNVQKRYRDIRVTQSVLGHTSVQSTQIYTDATDEQQRAARATLPRFSA